MQELIIDLLQISVPSIVVAVTIYSVIRLHFKKELALREAEMRIQNQNEILPVRLQAYERLTLFPRTYRDE